jgi:hypothetical protein
LHRRIITQPFLDGGHNQARVGVQRRPEGGVTQEMQEGSAEQVGSRFVAGKEQLFHECVQLARIQGLLAL